MIFVESFNFSILPTSVSTPLFSDIGSPKLFCVCRNVIFEQAVHKISTAEEPNLLLISGTIGVPSR